VAPERSIQIGMRGSLFSSADITQSLDLGYEVGTTDEIFIGGFPALAGRIRNRLGDHPAFLTFDMDFVDPAWALGSRRPRRVDLPRVRRCRCSEA